MAGSRRKAPATTAKRLDAARKTRTGRALAALECSVPTCRQLLEGATCFLEEAAVRPTTEEKYREVAMRFVEWCRLEGVDWTSRDGLDVAVVRFLCVLFQDGFESGTGSALVSALRHFMPALSTAKKEPLPRCERAMQGWRRLTPGKMRLPIPRSVAGAVAAYMLDHQLPEMAVFVLLLFVAMLRPGEALRLAPWSVVAPARGAETAFASWGLVLNAADLGVPGKTGLFDEAVPLDLDPWIHRPLAAVAHTRRDEPTLWPFGERQLRETFYSAIAFFGLQSLGAHLYSFRHGGASYDLLTKRRTTLEVKGMGRWLSDTCLRRYAKSTRLQAAVGQIPAALHRFGEEFIATLEDQITFKARTGVLRTPYPAAPVLQAPRGGRTKPKRSRA